jgi:hypothetical protein
MKNYFIILLVIAGLYFFACTKNEKQPLSEEETANAAVIFETLNLVEAKAKARAQNKLILIDFFSPT